MNKKWDTNWIVFTRKSRRGAFVFLGLFFIIAILPRISQLANISEIEIVRTNNEAIKTETKEIPVETPLQPFDPNQLDVEGWEQLGFSKKQAQVIINYKEKIGTFKTKEDVSSSYVITDTMYQKIEPYLTLPQKNNKQKTKNKEQRTKNKACPDKIGKQQTTNNEQQTKNESTKNINTLTQSDLIKIKGIGPYYAKTILTYRDKLGGFVAANQYSEIEKLPAELIDTLKEHTNIDTLYIKRININNEEHLENLHQHPYISKSIAHSIKVLKQQKGTFTKKEDVLQSPYIDIELYKKIKPYLTMDN